jgi:hypothetical protein
MVDTKAKAPALSVFISLLFSIVIDLGMRLYVDENKRCQQTSLTIE